MISFFKKTSLSKILKVDRTDGNAACVFQNNKIYIEVFRQMFLPQIRKYIKIDKTKGDVICINFLNLEELDEYYLSRFENSELFKDFKEMDHYIYYKEFDNYTSNEDIEIYIKIILKKVFEFKNFDKLEFEII